MADDLVPIPTTSVIQVRVKRQLREEIIRIAREQRRSESEMTRFLLEEALQARGVSIDKGA